MSKLDFTYLIAPHTAADFFANYWQKSPLLIKRDEVNRFQSLIPATDVAAILSIVEEFPSAAVDLVGSTRTIQHGPELSGGLAEFFRKGSTIRAKGLERFLSALKELCERIGQELRSPTRANLYCTPAGSRGFDLHFDTHEVLVLQLLGKKRWQVYEPVVKLPLEHLPSLPFEGDAEALRRSRGGRAAGQGSITQAELGKISLETILQPGDCLYLPRGFVHQAGSLDELSVHLTIGIHVLTWLDLFSVALGQSAYRHEAFRQGLPAGSLADPETKKELANEFAQRIQLFSHDAHFERALDELTASFMRTHGAEPDTASPASFDHQTKLEGNSQLEVYVSADGTMAALARGRKFFWMPACFAPVIRFVVEHRTFCPDQLPGQITDNGKVTFARRLVEDGFLRIAD
ncbi:MAG TPA: cupin domain-containing protein [Pyrinomonadaceae bacterium]|jgi:ribosomal protein L16 Arg81 hydroxylase|nr:cupin domain-containing protein [Pyrinomonadaceae bacterium]